MTWGITPFKIVEEYKGYQVCHYNFNDKSSHFLVYKNNQKFSDSVLASELAVRNSIDTYIESLRVKKLVNPITNDQ